MKILRPGDVIPLLLTIGIISLIGMKVYAPSAGEPVVYIQADEGEYLYPLEEDRKIEVQGPLGNSLILVEGEEVSFVDSPCPDKLCVHAAPLDEKGEWNACLPNRIFVRIRGGEGEEVLDDLAY